MRIFSLNQPDFEPLKNLAPFQIPGTSYNINLEVKYETPAMILNKILTKKADMIVTINRFLSETKGLVVQPLHNVNVCFVVSKKHILYHKDSTYKDFINEPLVIGVESHNHNFFETQESVQRDIASFGLNPSSVIILSDADAAIKAVANGKGIILGTEVSALHCNEDLICLPTNVTDQIVLCLE